MSSENQVKDLMGNTMDKIKQMVDVNTIIGEAIVTPDGTTVIPISKVSYGFASGGSDLPTKSPKETFGGLGGAGISIQPIGFLVINGSDIRLLQLSTAENTVNNIVNMVPEMVDKVSGIFSSSKNKKEKTVSE